MTMLIHSADKDRDKLERDRDRDRDKDQPPGVTLPSFTLGGDDDMDWEDNRLPPLHEWDDMGL